MEVRTWERRRRDDTGLPVRRRHVELRAGSWRLAWALPVLDARELERLFGRRMTAEEVAEARAERRRRRRRMLGRLWRWCPWIGF